MIHLDSRKGGNQVIFVFWLNKPIPHIFREAFRRRSKKQGGLHHFGIGKNGMSRAVVRFSGPPERHPTALCFHFPSTFLTHRFILDGVKEKIHLMTCNSVSSIAFVERNVLLGSRGLDNRWIITLASAEVRDELLRVGLFLYNRRVSLRRYDEVLQEEYRDFQEFVAYQKMLYGDVMPDEQESGVADETPSVEENANCSRKGRRRKGQRTTNRQKKIEVEAKYVDDQTTINAD